MINKEKQFNTTPATIFARHFRKDNNVHTRELITSIALPCLQKILAYVLCNSDFIKWISYAGNIVEKMSSHFNPSL